MRTSRRSDRGHVRGRGNNGYMRYKEGGCTCNGAGKRLGVNIEKRRGGPVHRRSTACSTPS
jgi:hypothetical protein